MLGDFDSPQLSGLEGGGDCYSDPSFYSLIKIDQGSVLSVQNGGVNFQISGGGRGDLNSDPSFYSLIKIDQGSVLSVQNGGVHFQISGGGRGFKL